MYGTIFKVQRDLTKDFERIREEEYYDNGFLGHIGDFVDDDTEVLDDYESLAKEYPGLYEVSINGTIKDSDDEEAPLAYLIIDVSKTKQFFKQRLIQYANQVAADPEFALTTKGKEMLDGDLFGTYVDVDGAYMTLDQFLIWVGNSFEGKATFRLEGTLDYHW